MKNVDCTSTAANERTRARIPKQTARAISEKPDRPSHREEHCSDSATCKAPPPTRGQPGRSAAVRSSLRGARASGEPGSVVAGSASRREAGFQDSHLFPGESSWKHISTVKNPRDAREQTRSLRIRFY